MHHTLPLNTNSYQKECHKAHASAKATPNQHNYQPRVVNPLQSWHSSLHSPVPLNGCNAWHDLPCLSCHTHGILCHISHLTSMVFSAMPILPHPCYVLPCPSCHTLEMYSHGYFATPMLCTSMPILPHP